MTIRHSFTNVLPGLMILFLLASCAPQVTFYVTRPSQLPVEKIEFIEFGRFEDIIGDEIAAPQGGSFSSSARLNPKVSAFTSNASSAHLVRSMLESGLSQSGQYRLVDSTLTVAGSGGVIPEVATTGVIHARVKYFERSFEDTEGVFYLLMALKSGLELREQAILMASKQGIIAAAERGRKGFKVDTPYVEKIAAMEVTFDLQRKSTGVNVVAPQTLRSYYVQKWGGLDQTSHLPGATKSAILGDVKEQRSLFDLLTNEADRIEKVIFDPEEFLALGGKLENNPSVPANSLDIQVRLGNHIVDRYLRRISQYTEQTELEVASGDSIAMNYIKGNAYEMAINRLENIERAKEDSFNLALAYESIGENNQAAKFYQEALDKDPKNKSYKKALRRVRKR